jgi:hypothetical protein
MKREKRWCAHPSNILITAIWLTTDYADSSHAAPLQHSIKTDETVKDKTIILPPDLSHLLQES